MSLPTTHYPAHGTVETDRLGPYSHGSRIGFRPASAVHACHQLCPVHCPEGREQADAKNDELFAEMLTTPVRRFQKMEIKIPFEEHDVGNQTVQPPDQQDDPFGPAEMVFCTPSEKEKEKTCWESGSEESMFLDSPSESVVAEQQEELWHYERENRPQTPPSEPRPVLAPARPRKQAGPSHLPVAAPKPCPGNLEEVAALRAMVSQLQADMEEKNLRLLQMMQENGCPCANPKTCPCEARAGHWPEWPEWRDITGSGKGTHSSAASASDPESGSSGPPAPARRTHAVPGRSTGCVMRAPQSDTESEDGVACLGFGDNTLPPGQRNVHRAKKGKEKVSLAQKSPDHFGPRVSVNPYTSKPVAYALDAPMGFPDLVSSGTQAHVGNVGIASASAGPLGASPMAGWGMVNPHAMQLATSDGLLPKWDGQVHTWADFLDEWKDYQSLLFGCPPKVLLKCFLACLPERHKMHWKRESTKKANLTWQIVCDTLSHENRWDDTQQREAEVLTLEVCPESLSGFSAWRKEYEYVVSRQDDMSISQQRDLLLKKLPDKMVERITYQETKLSRHQKQVKLTGAPVSAKAILREGKKHGKAALSIVELANATKFRCHSADLEWWLRHLDNREYGSATLRATSARVRLAPNEALDFLLDHFGEQQHEKDTKNLYKAKASVLEVQASVVQQQPAKQQQHQQQPARQQQQHPARQQQQQASQHQQPARDLSPYGPRKCHGCGSLDHLVHDCPKRKEELKKQAQNRFSKSDEKQGAPSQRGAAPSCRFCQYGNREFNHRHTDCVYWLRSRVEKAGLLQRRPATPDPTNNSTGGY